MSEKVKLIALDMDGTLFNDKLEIPFENQRMIRAAVAAGVHVIISTGRPYVGLAVEMLADLGISYVITSNGGGIYRIPEKECVFSKCIPPEISVPMIRYLQTKDIVYDACIDGIRYRESKCQHIVGRLTQYPEATRLFLENNPILVEDLAAFIEKQQHHVEKMTLNFYPLSDGSFMDREEVWNYLSSNSAVTVVSGGCENIECTLAGTTKANGLRFLAKLLGVPMESTMACGDAQNDADIVRAAAIGVAMENASDDLKAIADFVTKSNNDSGVAHAIEKFVF